MSNFDDWSTYTKHIGSPQPWIDASFYFMIGAALQRRVWFGGLDAHPVFPNVFMTFIGPAGTGKSLPMTAMKSILDIKVTPSGDAQGIDADLLAEENDKAFAGAGKPLVYFAPNSTSFEQLVKETASVCYVHRYKDERGINKQYPHSSLIFVLDELTSIFKKHSEDLTNYLLEAYNGGKKYVRKLKHNGSDFCTNLCVSMLGNTTDDKFREMQNVSVLTDGFMSRSIIVYAHEDRFGMFMIPDLSAEQVAARDRLQAYMRKLHTVFGPMGFAPGVFEYCNERFVSKDPTLITNKHPMLAGYYARKNLHFMKLLLAVHFADRPDMTITREDVDKTFALMASWEKQMHIPFVGLGRNETARIGEDMYRFVMAAGLDGITRRALFSRFYSTVKTVTEFDAVIKDLTELDKIKSKIVKGESGYVGK